MKIGFFGSNQYYNNKVNKTAKQSSGGQPQKAEICDKRDTILLSYPAPKGSFEGLVRQMAQEVMQYDSTERIAALRQAVRDGSYSVSAQEVADAILSRVEID